jgi:hypothetical protein
MDFFEIKTFGKSGMPHRLMRRFFTDRLFQKRSCPHDGAIFILRF